MGEAHHLTSANRSNNAGTSRSNELTFVESNWPVLQSRYTGRWIAVERDQVVADASTEQEADAVARGRGKEIPFVLFIPEPDEAPFVGAL
jgi:hypothetical protein